MRSASGAAIALLLLVLPQRAVAQDTTAHVRHVLALDVSRVQPFRRAYDMIVHTGDSAVVIGQRDVALTDTLYAGAPAWLLVETRTGVVPAAESLYLARDLRPIHWSSALGAARLGLEFVGDSIYGGTTSPMGRRSIVFAGRPDLLVSASMVELILPLLPLAPTWVDSAGVFAVDLAATSIIPAELAVIGEENVAVDSVSQRPAWIVALRMGGRNVLYWVDRESGAALRVDQPLMPHTGTLLEYRIRPEALASIPPP